ncbi:dynamin family protein [Nonomuraea ferruginea]|uniref:50S ribosome-binding GTPase n=1 Tax=Nonomuraea ferruginea TaxID=46174 RepID=A0ABT4T344_9ACTN|nr:dynamin family protein [Nonomuraea ferruginea]MDA0643897.1 50S ribosome-binding GTPase [Nonomuraea ferruginea]
MDDGRGERPGEQTLSLPAITDAPPGPPADLPAEPKRAAGRPPGAKPEREATGPPESSAARPGRDSPAGSRAGERSEPESPAGRREPGVAERSEPEFDAFTPFASGDSKPGPEAPAEPQFDAFGPVVRGSGAAAAEPEPATGEETDQAPEGTPAAKREPVAVEDSEPEAPAESDASEAAESGLPAEAPGDSADEKAVADEDEADSVPEEPEAKSVPEDFGDEPDSVRESPETEADSVPEETETETDSVPEETETETDSVSEGPEADSVPDKPEAEAESVSEGPEAEGVREEELPPETVKAMAAALGALRESVASLRFGLDLPGAGEARKASGELLAQLEDYVLPRVRMNTAPALIVVAGSTGAGKSTLVNSLAEKNVSRTGVRRPTTGVPVLVCHPDDRQWFAEGELLGGLRRFDQARPEAGQRGIVISATEKLPQGVALLDTPDIDSVVEEHHEIAHRMLDAADLWIFVTTAARYADAPAWNLLRLAKERGARLAIVLSRVQDRAREVVLKHFVRMLTEYGLGEIDRFVISESKVADGRLPDSEVTEVRLWLAELSVDGARRAQAVKETLNGVLDSFRTRVPALAKHLEAQVAFRGELRGDVEAAYLGALTDLDKAFRSGALIHGEVLARWQDFAGSGDLMRSLQLRKRARSGRQTPERIIAFRAALRAGLESVIVAAATRAAEEVTARWRHRAEVGAALADGLERPSDDLVRHAGRAVAAWQEHVTELVRTEGVAKRTVSKLVSFDADSLSLIFMVAMFSGGHVEGVPHRLVKALLGAESLRGIGAKALSDLRARISMLFDEESMRYVQALDSAGIPDESAATRLYQATYNLEVAR